MKVHPKFWQMLAATELLLLMAFARSAYIDPETGMRRGKLPGLVSRN